MAFPQSFVNSFAGQQNQLHSGMPRPEGDYGQGDRKGNYQ
jgi:hypothetical protein